MKKQIKHGGLRSFVQAGTRVRAATTMGRCMSDAYVDAEERAEGILNHEAHCNARIVKTVFRCDEAKLEEFSKRSTIWLKRWNFWRRIRDMNSRMLTGRQHAYLEWTLIELNDPKKAPPAIKRWSPEQIAARNKELAK